MRRRSVRIGLLVIALVALGSYYVLRARQPVLTLTGLVTTDDVIVAAQVAGRIDQLSAEPGQTVTRDQVMAVIAPEELKADRAYYAHVADSAAASIQQNEAALRFQEEQNAAALRQAEASVAAADASLASAQADLENAKLTYQRTQNLQKNGVASTEELDQARTTFEATTARVNNLGRQADAARAAVALAQANAQQIAVRRSQLQASRSDSEAAAAQRDKAAVRLGYTEVRAPVNGIVDVRAARQGEVVGVGQPIATLINPDDLWVRVDIEETYIDRIRLGDKLPVVLPSGDTREGTVFYRAVDGSYATQRDVSRTKRDIRTFEVRLRVPDPDHRLAVGMTAYVKFAVPQ
ncbi:MAG TPA: HlyD family efflux transporter periplasmic adaptor subunit [Vicinamibacterales bacterium]|jgi:multidrug resistance efflux pump|nr:HlyD family efflux transporter periplasmic adaptor subunit [Vicinamibacterales bacterium]